MLVKQVYEVEAVQKLSPMSTTKQQMERDCFDRSMDEALAKCESTDRHE